jgi:hypothetical protein
LIHQASNGNDEVSAFPRMLAGALRLIGEVRS